MRNLELDQYGCAELTVAEMSNTDGEYSWNQFCNDVGYGVGAIAGYATNAAEIATDILIDTAKVNGSVITKRPCSQIGKVHGLWGHFYPTQRLLARLK